MPMVMVEMMRKIRSNTDLSQIFSKTTTMSNTFGDCWKQQIKNTFVGV